MFAFYNFVSGYADIVADRYRKTVNNVKALCIKFFYGLPDMKKQKRKSVSNRMHSPVETTIAQHIWHQFRTFNKTDRFFNIPAEILRGYKQNCNDFCICSFATFMLSMINRFEQIIKKYVYCLPWSIIVFTCK